MSAQQFDPKHEPDKRDHTFDTTQINIEGSEDLRDLPEISCDISLPSPTLTIVKGPSAGLTFELERTKPTTMGRDIGCSIFLNNMTVSRLHATITRTDDGLQLVDEGSLNGTWVNGTIVNDVILRDGDVIQIGTFVLSLQLPANY